MVDVRDVVMPEFGVLNQCILISEVSGVQKYENGKKTGEIIGYKGTFLVTTETAKGLQIVVKIDDLDKPDWEMMKNYQIDFDKEKSTVYIQNGRMALSLWAKQVTEIN